MGDKFDYMLSNPPFGVDWKKIKKEILDEHNLKGFDGRFGSRAAPGVGWLTAFFDAPDQQDARRIRRRVGVSVSILNGSPLFTGGAGSGESEIRRYILEADLLEAIVALPNRHVL